MSRKSSDFSEKSKPLSIDDVVDALPHRPISTTRERGWSGVTVDVYRMLADCAGSYPAMDHHLVCYVPSGRARLLQGRDGIRHESVLSAGMSLLMPAGYDSQWDGDAAASVRLRIPTPLIDAAAEQVGMRSLSQFEIRNVFEMRDPLIEHVARILLAEMEREPHPTQALIIDAMSCALAAHLLRSHNAFDSGMAYEASPLGRVELEKIRTFIEDNIGRTIELGELASLVNVSRFHFGRMFKRSTGMTAIRYVESVRIGRAQVLISETGLALAEIALITGFADQSHFTRRFHKCVGCTPASYARAKGRRRSSAR